MAVNQIKQFEKTSKIYVELAAKQQQSILRSQSEIVIKQFEIELSQAENLKKNAQVMLKSATMKLGERQNELKYWISKTGSGTIGNQENIESGTNMPKDFLASEKLASTKKQISLSPIKPKQLRKRNSSFSRNK